MAGRSLSQMTIGREGPITWPVRSPDLTPIELYVRSHIKRLVYDEAINEAIKNAIEQIKIVLKNAILKCELGKACVSV